MHQPLRERFPLDSLPERARRYLTRAVADDAPLADAARLRMHGEIRLRDRWHPFVAEQWLAPGEGFEWRATARVDRLPVRGFDRYAEGLGRLRWRLLGLLPVLEASGPDIDRSARGRLACEAVWLPTALLPGRGVRWSRLADGRLRASRMLDGVDSEVRLDVDPTGRLRSVAATRWGDPDGRGFRLLPFGGVAHEEATFHGLTVPRRLSVGWWFGTRRFESEGEFFRVTLDALEPERFPPRRDSGADPRRQGRGFTFARDRR